MTFQDIVVSINKLNHEWYISKKKFFEMEKGFIKERNLVFVNWGTYTDDDYDEETGEYFQYEKLVDELKTYEINFFEYCWNSDFENSLYRDNISITKSGPEETFILPTDVNTIFNILLSYLEALFSNTVQLEYKVPKLKQIVDIIKSSFLEKEFQESEYNILMENLFGMVNIAILKKYGNWLELYELKSTAERQPIIGIANKGIEIADKAKAINDKPIVGFKYLQMVDNPEAIKDLHHSLVDSQLIDDKNTLPSFKRLFFGKTVTSQIIWKGTISELAFFIKKMTPKIESPKMHWIIGAAFFKLEHKVITPQQLHDAKKPSTHKNIEKAIMIFK